MYLPNQARFYGVVDGSRERGGYFALRKHPRPRSMSVIRLCKALEVLGTHRCASKGSPSKTVSLAPAIAIAIVNGCCGHQRLVASDYKCAAAYITALVVLCASQRGRAQMFVDLHACNLPAQLPVQLAR